MNQDVTFVGMDLGSFKTSVCCSNGRRETVASAVGWPKDHIARNLLGREVVFGDDIVAQPLAVNIVRPFGMGAFKYNDYRAAGVASDCVDQHREAAQLLVRHVVSLVTELDAPIYGVVGAPSRATVDNKQAIFEAARSAFDAVVIVPEPFAVAYGMGKLANALIIDIGAGTIDLCPMYGAYPLDEDQLTLPIGGDHIDARLEELLRETYPAARLDARSIRAMKEKYGSVSNDQAPAIVTLPVDGRPKDFNVSELLRSACQSIVPAILEGIKTIVTRFDLAHQQTLLNNIVLAGGGSQLKGLDRLLEESLADYGGGNVTRVYDSVFAGAAGALKLGIELPLENWERLTVDGTGEPSKAA